jgi:hypothetical protein
MTINRKLIFIQILQARVDLVTELIDPSNFESIELNPMDGNAEEHLRKLMVVIIPRINCDNPSDSNTEKFFSVIHQLKEPAMSLDYRFLDAWNHGFESISNYKNFLNNSSVQFFYSEYLKLLKYHIDKMDAQ